MKYLIAALILLSSSLLSAQDRVASMSQALKGYRLSQIFALADFADQAGYTVKIEKFMKDFPEEDGMYKATDGTFKSDIYNDVYVDITTALAKEFKNNPAKFQAFYLDLAAKIELAGYLKSK